MYASPSPCVLPAEVAEIIIQTQTRHRTPEDVFTTHTATFSEPVYGSLAPYLLLTQKELSSIPGIGKRRQTYAAEMLKKAALRTRHPSESVHDRARQVYGSIEMTPLQALLVVSAFSGNSVTAQYMESPAVKVIVSITPGITIGSLVNYLDTGLHRLFDAHEVAIDKRHIGNIEAELNSRVPTWRQSFLS